MRRYKRPYLLLHLLLFSLLTFVSSCKRGEKPVQPDPVTVNERLTQMNRKFVESESKAIDDFIKQHGFRMKMTGTGLRYEITSEGKGRFPAEHEKVKIRYRLFLTDGTFCYEADSVVITLGQNEETRGLEEGLLLMKPGAKARLVVPAHLGFGISGDGEKIPPASSLYYDLEFISILP